MSAAIPTLLPPSAMIGAWQAASVAPYIGLTRRCAR
jgi:hypothetical protein